MTTTAHRFSPYIKPFVGTVTIVICTAGMAACREGMNAAVTSPVGMTTPAAPSAPPPTTPTSSSPMPPGPMSTGQLLSVYPTKIYLGESAIFSWSPPDEDQPCTGSGAWAVPTTLITPTAVGTSTYIITCPLDSGSTTTSSVTLTVVPAGNQWANYVLVSNAASGGGAQIDPNLVNPWGIDANEFFESESTGSPVAAVAINGFNTNVDYVFYGQLSPVPVHFPANFAPTGILIPNGSVTVNGQGCQLQLIAASTSGQIAGWDGAADLCLTPGETPPATAVIAYTASDGAVYTGLSQAVTDLLAADFHNSKIDVFDQNIRKQSSVGSSAPFTDPTLPPNYAPYNAQAIFSESFSTNEGTFVFVTYAQRDPHSPDSAAIGAGLGLVDVFDISGNFVRRLISPGGALNAPWGVALAPGDFGSLSNDLLVANYGDGHINAYNPTTGQFIGAVVDASGSPMAVPGLRGITFANEESSIDKQGNDVLFYTAAGAGQNEGAVGNIFVMR
jgi:uncharacterized protein (TIGR03118 family)